jgi:hypothetical protein
MPQNKKFKKKSFTKIIFNLVVFGLILLNILLWNLTSLKIQDLKIVGPNNSESSDVLLQNNHFFGNDKAGKYEFSGKIFKNNYSQSYVKILVDNCLESLEINNVQINLKDKFTQKELCNFENGLDFKLGDYLVNGENQVKIVVFNSNSNTGLILGNSFSDKGFLALMMVLYILVCLIIYQMFKYLNLGNIPFLIICGSLMVCLVYLSYTNFSVRHYDADGKTGHMGYINFIYQNKTFPDPTQGWQYYQPPLYYLISALIFGVGKFFEVNNIFSWIQISGIFYYLIFLTFGFLTFKIFIKNNFWFNLACILLAFWPSGFIHASRVGNDQLLSTFSVASFYFLTKWLFQKKFQNIPKNKYLIVSFIFIFLGLLTKNTILPIVIFSFLVFGCLELSNLLKYLNATKPDNKIQKSKVKKFLFLTKDVFDYFKQNFLRFLKVYLPLIILVIFGFSLSAAKNYFFNQNKKSADWLVGNISNLSSALGVDNSAYNYLYFNLQIFLKFPFTNTYVDEKGRQFFWNFLLKTSLFAEFSFKEIKQQNLATILSFILVILVIFVIIFILRTFIQIFDNSSNSETFSQKITQESNFQTLFPKFSTKNNLPNLYLSTFLLILILSVLNFTIKNPFSSCQDFRFIYPALVPFIGILTLGFSSIYNSKWRFFSILGVFISSLFVIFSIWFFVIGLN